MPNGEIAPEDALTVICSNGYHVERMTGDGVVLLKDRHSFPVLLPFGIESIPAVVIERLVIHCNFNMDDFWKAIEEARTVRMNGEPLPPK